MHRHYRRPRKKGPRLLIRAQKGFLKKSEFDDGNPYRYPSTGQTPSDGVRMVPLQHCQREIENSPDLKLSNASRKRGGELERNVEKRLGRGREIRRREGKSCRKDKQNNAEREVKLKGLAKQTRVGGKKPHGQMLMANLSKSGPSRHKRRKEGKGIMRAVKDC